MKITGLARYISYAIGLSVALTSAQEKITFESHVLPILENRCTSCHNPDDPKGGLDVSTYQALLNGGSGGSVVESEDASVSRLYTLMAHTQEPHMPPRKPKSPDPELEMVAKWIAGGLLETANSKARKSDKPKLDMNLTTSTGKPEGPAAMPEHVILQPELVTERPNAVPALAHSPWAPIVAVAGQKQVILYHSSDFDVLGILPYPEGFPQSLSFSTSGAILQAGGGRGGKSGLVVAWDVKTGERVIEVGREYDIVLGSDIAPDHRKVVLGGPSKIFKIWDTVTGEQVAAVKKHPDWMLTADFSPDGVLLATGDRSGGLYVWEGGSGLEFYTLKGHTKAVTDLAWRPDSNALASISEDGLVILWEMGEGKEVKKWSAHGSGALGIDFSPDGSMLASVGRDKTLKLWKPDGTAIRTINASDDIVMSVVFTEDNKRCITGDYNGVIKVWNVADGAELAKLDANPPTLEKQIEEAEKKLTEVKLKVPQMEQTVAAVQNEANQVRTSLEELKKAAAELAMKKQAMANELTGFDNKVKTLSVEKNDTQAKVTQNTSLMQQRAAERARVEQELKKVIQEYETAKTALNQKNAAFQAALVALDQGTKAAAAPVFDDTNKEKVYQATRGMFNSAVLARQQAEAEVVAKQKAFDELNGKLSSPRKILTDLQATHSQALRARDAAQNQLNAADQKRKEADAKVAEASKNNPAVPVEFAQAQQMAIKQHAEAEKSLAAANDVLAQAYAKLKTHEPLVAQAEALLKAPTDQLAGAKNVLAQRVVAHQKVDADLQVYLAEGGARMQMVAKAKAELPAKVAAHQKADAELKQFQNGANQSAAKVTQLQGQLKSALAAEDAARGDMENSLTQLMTKTKELTTSSAKLNETKTTLTTVEQRLSETEKKKETQAKAIEGIVAKEAEVRKGYEVVKAEFEQSQFLAQKFKAAAINYEAKLESEKLSDMNSSLTGMLDEETEAKVKFKDANTARIEAEQTLAQAEKTVAEGTQKLKETSSNVLDRALALIASRTAADLREEIIREADTAPDASAPVNEAPVASQERFSVASAEVLFPEEVVERVAVIETVSSALAVQTPEEINAEIASIQKHLDELSNFIAVSYTEADKTVNIVERAADVAAKTPAVIVERGRLEQARAQAAESIEKQRTEQETAVAQQMKLIEDLRARYLQSVPQRKM